MKTILAIDPGNIESAYVLLSNEYSITKFDKIDNNSLINLIYDNPIGFDVIVIEMISSYGMPVGKDVFDTCVWIGRFLEAAENESIKIKLIYRKEVKMNLCATNRAKDSNIIQSLIDRFANVNIHGKYGKGTKNNPGYFYGFNKDIWQAYALGVTYSDLCKEF